MVSTNVSSMYPTMRGQIKFAG